MTRKEAVFQFFRKSIVPVVSAALLVCIFKSACVKDGAVNYLWFWTLCGLPFGLHRMWLWFVPGGGSMGGGVALFLLNFIIGEFTMVWQLIAAVRYVSLTAYRLITGYTASSKRLIRARNRWALPSNDNQEIVKLPSTK